MALLKKVHSKRITTRSQNWYNYCINVTQRENVMQHHTACPTRTNKKTVWSVQLFYIYFFKKEGYEQGCWGLTILVTTDIIKDATDDDAKGLALGLPE